MGKFIDRMLGRTLEATSEQLAATGAYASGGGVLDPIDGDRGYVRLGQGPMEQPRWTTAKARAYSVAAYRSQPMARAMIDTYVSFCVGDSGLSPQSDDPQVRAVVDEWWNDPRNKLADDPTMQLLFVDWMMMGEVVWEYMVGADSGVVRISPIAPTRIKDVHLERGNPLWFDSLSITGIEQAIPIVKIDEITGLRAGVVGYTPSWRTLITDRRGTPFLTPVLDDLDAYSQVLSNLVDRTALARYAAFDVTVNGADQTEIDQIVKERGGKHFPASGSVEFHNEQIVWKPLDATSGAAEDTQTAGAILTNVAAGSGLAKTWLAEPDGANRATSMSMAEPVRRRVGGVQMEWLGILTEAARFAVDQAVNVGRLPRMIASQDQAGNEVMVAPAQLVRITGPEIAAADAQVTAAVMVNLATAIDSMVTSQVLSPEAGSLAVEKAWSSFVGRPFPKNLSTGKALKVDADATAEEIEKAQTEGRLFLLPTFGGH